MVTRRWRLEGHRASFYGRAGGDSDTGRARGAPVETDLHAHQAPAPARRHDGGMNLPPFDRCQPHPVPRAAL